MIRGNSKCTQVLIEAGADVNGRRNHEPIWAAAYYGDVWCMEILIKAGAGVNKVGTACSASLRKAHNYGNDIILENSTPLMDAIRCRNAKCVDLLISAGADVNVIDSHGNTPFIFSCYCGINTAKLLLEAGAKINMVNAFGGNAFEEILQDEYVALHGIPPDRTMVYFCTLPGRYSMMKTMVLFQYAAGETIGCAALEKQRDSGNVAIPDVLFEENLQFNLKHLCREAIRKHLLKLDPHIHLFGRVPRLGLPQSLTDYLLYNCTLDIPSKISDDSADPEH